MRPTDLHGENAAMALKRNKSRSFAAVASGTLAVICSTPAYSQSCQPGPKCQAADLQAQQAMAGWKDFLSSPSTHVSSEVAYCSNMAVVGTALICQQEFLARGDSECAEVAARQARQNELAAVSALSVAKRSAATSNWTPACNAIGQSGGLDGDSADGLNDSAIAKIGAKMNGSWVATHTDSSRTSRWDIELDVKADGSVTGSYSYVSNSPGLPPFRSSSKIDGHVDIESDAVIANITSDGQLYTSKIIDLSGEPKIDDGWVYKPVLTRK